MTSMKIVEFSQPTTPCPSTSEILPPSWPWMSNFEWTPPPSSQNDNQSIKRKHDPRMNIVCYQRSNYGINHHLQWLLLTFSQMGHWPEYLQWFYNGYNWHHIVFLNLLTCHIFNVFIENGLSDRNQLTW